jgi:hypothetical protein
MDRKRLAAAQQLHRAEALGKTVDAQTAGS